MKRKQLQYSDSSSEDEELLPSATKAKKVEALLGEVKSKSAFC